MPTNEERNETEMELKTNYQYTYFIYPFVINEGKYQKYLLKLLKDKKCKLKVFQKEKDIRMYKYFLPKIKEFLFSSFTFDKNKLNNLDELPVETRAAILSKYACNIFEYELKKDIQGKIGEKNGIFFNIQNIQIICFNTGICFLAIKTNLEDYKDFSNILNFNYKFRDINNEVADLNTYDNIRIQTDSFSDIETFKEFIYNITGSNIEATKLNLDTERFLTYSYVCIDEASWNLTNNFENIKEQYLKYVNIYPADSIKKIEYNESETFSKWKYAKLGLSKLGIMLFASSADMNNYTILPEEYEGQYFYTYILNLYKKIYLKKINTEFKNPNKVKTARKRFIEFTRNLWIQEITEDETGTILSHKLQEIFELDKLYTETKMKYDTLYKELNIEKDRKITIFIAVTLVISLIFNILNFIELGKS